MKRLVLEVPNEILVSLKENTHEFSKDLLMFAAIKLYELRKLSSGRAAQLAGVSRVSFLQSLSQYSVPIFNLTEDELRQDLENA